MPHRRAAAPCITPESGDPHTSFLHLEELNKEDKAKWVAAAGAAGLPLPEWVQRVLNQAAAREAMPPAPSQP